MLRKALAAIAAFFHSFLLPEKLLLTSQKWALGLANLAAVILFWVLSSFLVSDLFETNIYRKPYFITWINTSCFAFYLIPYFKYNCTSIPDFIELLKEDYNLSRYSRLVDVELRAEPLREYGASRDGSPDTQLDLEAETSKDLEDEEVGPWETVTLSLQFIVLWFSANLVTNASLSFTSVASQTILLSTSSFFTLLFGYLFSIEKINLNKIVGIVITFAGVVIVTKIDSSSDSLPTGLTPLIAFLGNMLALSGALIYGAYTILLKHKITKPDSFKERILNTHLFFGFVGVYCLIMMWPFLIVLHFTGIETFELPNTSHVLLLLLINAVITFISDFCWCKAVLLTSPLTVTVGLSLTIPIAMVGDWLFKGFHINLWYLFGAFIVSLGFLVINKNEKEDFVTDSDRSI